MKRTNKALSLLLAFYMVLALLPWTALPAHAAVTTGQLLGNTTDGYYVNMPQNNKKQPALADHRPAIAGGWWCNLAQGL